MSGATSVIVEPPVYTTTEAHQRAGIGVRQVWHWLSAQVITPSVFRASGAGSNNLWSAEDVTVLALLGELSKLGAQTDVLAEAEPMLRGVVRERQTIRGNDLVLVARSPLTVSGVRASRLAAAVAERPTTGYWLLDLRLLSI